MSAERKRIVVTRGDRFDIAEWSPGEPSWIGGAPEVYRPPSSSAPFVIGISLLAIVAIVVIVRRDQPEARRPLVATVADLQAVHAGVSARGSAVRRGERLAAGDVVETDGDGRARLRLDDGTAVVLDRKTKLTAREGGIELAEGRVFVLGAPGARTALDLGGGSAVVSGADVGVARTGGEAKIYVARAEITVRASDGVETTVRAGDTATLAGGKVTVAPERGYDDWTAGMAAPWGASGAPRRAVGELWGRASLADAGAPLTLRSHEVRATINRELAETDARTTFFNGGSAAVIGDFRFALPPGAIVSRFAVARGENVTEGRVALAARNPSYSAPNGNTLEWAGEGWVRGTIPSIAPGEAVTVIVGYAEWLAPRPRGEGKNLVVEYRYPMVGDGAPPLVGELFARIDAGPSSPISLAAGQGARVDGSAVELRRPDFRPTADLVVDVEIAPSRAGQDARAESVPPARLYAASPTGDDDAGTVLVRTELGAREAAADNVTLALVMDASGSVEPALLDAERALVDAILGGLGARDRVVVLAADQTARFVGPQTIGPADAARRKEITAALAQVGPGGATDLGRAIEAGADALGDAPAGMVIYIGDGWPTVGDGTVDLINARLARRKGGAPRLGAVAVGPLANRFALAALTRGSGPLLEIADGADAARAAIELLADALRPTVAGVELDLGPEVDRVYPRGARAVVAGDTVAAVGRFRGDLPREITLRWRDAAGAHEERRPVVVVKTTNESDVVRRWAAARVEEIALAGRGREAATDVALRAGLLTPWTGWISGGADTYDPTRLETRILDLAVGREAGFTAAFATPRASFGTLTNVVHETEDEGAADDKEDALKGPVAAAARRVLEAANAAVRACRDSRAALRPELAGSLDVALELDGAGHALSVHVKGSTGADDDALDRCVEGVVLGLSFPASGLSAKIAVHHVIDLPPPRLTPRGRRCSATSTLPMPLRRGVWRERLDRGRAADVYLEAKHGCELPTWTDKRALLELVLLQNEDGLARVAVARELDRAGEADAAALLRREAVRRARSADELRAVRVTLVGDEHYPVGLFRKQYAAATDDEGRLAIVRRYLSLAPHDARLRRRLFALLEARGMKQALADEIRLVRGDPFADAGLLADGASALRRIGDEAGSRRAFGELVERAPTDPWARAFLGDRLRNEGWFDDAEAAYAALEQLVPGDPAAALRLALAHAGAGRLDIAERTLARVAQTGGRAGDAKLGDLAGRLALALIAEALARPGLSAADVDQLARVALELPRPQGATLILVRAPAGAHAVEARLLRGPKDAREERAPEIAAEGIGLYALRLDPGDGTAATLRLRRPAELAPARPTKVRVDALVPDGEGKPPKRVSTEVDLPISGKALEIAWNGAAWGG